MKNNSKKLVVAVLSGGFSNERDISLISGENVFRMLDRSKYVVKHIDLSHKTVRTLPTLLKNVDVAFLALHGIFGEDGHIQAILESLDIPYTGSNVLSSALAMDKYRTMVMAEVAGLTIPKSLLATKKDLSHFSTFANKAKKLKYPLFVKPNASGSSVGAGIAKNSTELKKRIQDSLKHDKSVLVQEFIRGRELTCGVIGNTGELVLPLPPVEIPKQGEFFDRKIKYADKTVELCPAPLSKAQTKKIQNLSVLIHETLGCDGVTRSDFLLKGNTFYFLETNTIPGLTENSLVPKEAKAMGMTFPKYLDAQITLALRKK